MKSIRVALCAATLAAASAGAVLADDADKEEFPSQELINLPTDTEMKDMPRGESMETLPTDTRMKSMPSGEKLRDLPTDTKMKDLPTDTKMKDSPEQ